MRTDRSTLAASSCQAIKISLFSTSLEISVLGYISCCISSDTGSSTIPIEGLNVIVCASMSLKRVPKDGRWSDETSVVLTKSEDRVDGTEDPIDSAGVMKPEDDADKSDAVLGV